MTDRQEAYHNETINGETPETLDPRHTIPGHSARQFLALRNMTSAQARLGPAGPSGIHPMATLYFDSLDAIKAGVASPQGQAAAGDLATLRTGARSPIFLIQRTFERGATDNVD